MCFDKRDWKVNYYYSFQTMNILDFKNFHQKPRKAWPKYYNTFMLNEDGGPVKQFTCVQLNASHLLKTNCCDLTVLLIHHWVHYLLPAGWRWRIDCGSSWLLSSGINTSMIYRVWKLLLMLLEFSYELQLTVYYHPVSYFFSRPSPSVLNDWNWTLPHFKEPVAFACCFCDFCFSRFSSCGSHLTCVCACVSVLPAGH